MIDIDSEFQFIEEKPESAKATGFVVDAELGIIATNRHVTRRAPTRHKIKFYDGSVARGTVKYYDFYHDFGFIQLDLMRDKDFKENPIYKNLKAVEIGSSYDLRIGDELMLIGNNEGVNYSIKYGNVVELNLPDLDGFGSIIQTSFDRTGGSSGSPVWNGQGKVVSIHAMGDKSFSFEVPIEYLKSALNTMQSNYKVGRKNIFEYKKAFSGIYVNLIPLYKLELSINQFSKNSTNKDEIKELIIKSKSLQRVPSIPPEVIQVSSIIGESPSDGHLKSGDIILKINEYNIGNDLIKFEEILDTQLQTNTTTTTGLSFTIYRFGNMMTISGINLKSTEDEKITKFIKFANTIIHPINFYVKSILPALKYHKGLFVSQIGVSSPFKEINKSGGIVVSSLNSITLNSLDDLIFSFNKTCDRANIYIEALNLEEEFPRFESYPIDLGDLTEVHFYEFDQTGWTSKAIKLHKCEESNSRRINSKELFQKNLRFSSQIRKEYFMHSLE